MRRKFLFGLLFAALALPVFAGTAAAANPSNCSNATSYNDWATANVPAWTTKMRSVRAVMYAPYRIDDCIDSPPLDLVSGPSYWVALVSPGNGNAIIQIGVIKCQDVAYAACTGAGRLFWAYSGCGAFQGPWPRDLGPAPSSGAEFIVERRPDGNYLLTADYNNDGSIEYSRTIYKGDSAISCWADTGNVNAQVSCERWDSGDMCGTSLDRVAAHGVQYKNTVGGSFHPANWTSGYCQESNSETQCAITDSDSAEFWTAQ